MTTNYNPADQQAGIAYAERVATERFASTGEQVSQTTRMLMGCAFEAGVAHGRGQVPAEMDVDAVPGMRADYYPEEAYCEGWNACRAAMIAAQEGQSHE